MKLLPLLATAALLTACANEADRMPPLVPNLAEGKADAGDKVVRKGVLGLGADLAMNATFTEDLEFHGYELSLSAGADVRLEVTQKGSSRGLDTTLYVYGPRHAATDTFGTAAKGFDDDAGYAKLSLLKSFKAEGGTYLVVIGTRDGRGRGNYRLEARCNGTTCAPAAVAEVCHAEFLTAISQCVASWHEDPDFDPSVTSTWEMTYQCADVEPLSPVRDALCAAADHDFCALNLERFALDYVADCRTEALHRLLDTSCVFGEVYRDLFGHAEAMVVLERKVLRKDTAVNALQREQIIAAVRQTAYDDVNTLDDAFDAVDEGLVNLVELWDASNRRAYTAYEVGAGDNSYGAIFEQGTTTIAAKINDGDLYGCTATWGDERRRCWGDDDCRTGTTCLGRSEGSGLGRCLAPHKDTHPALDQSCSSVDGLVCPAGSGLLCGGAALGGEGMCIPAWMRGTFISEPVVAIPDNDTNGIETQILAYGLATVDMDVRLDLHIGHPRPADLKVTLTNPADHSVVVFDGATDTVNHGEIYFRGRALRGFSGDESVNGVWRLKVVDSRSGHTGTLYEFGLELTSRWD